tara:strand:+ start:624 stop:725 length:102 start_codon:yes stop_codon:yes gene_type:complete
MLEAGEAVLKMEVVLVLVVLEEVVLEAHQIQTA